VTWADGFERKGTSSPTLEGKGACMPCVEPDGPPLVGTQTPLIGAVPTSSERKMLADLGYFKVKVKAKRAREME